MACADCVLFDRKRRRCDAGYEGRPPSECPNETHELGCDCERCEAAEAEFNEEPAGEDYGSPLHQSEMRRERRWEGA